VFTPLPGRECNFCGERYFGGKDQILNPPEENCAICEIQANAVANLLTSAAAE
jgi:hypothetical protein